MSLDKLCKATGLTLAIVGLSMVHSFAIEEQTAKEQTAKEQTAKEPSVSKQSAEEQTTIESKLTKIAATHFPMVAQQEIERNITR